MKCFLLSVLNFIPVNFVRWPFVELFERWRKACLRSICHAWFYTSKSTHLFSQAEESKSSLIILITFLCTFFSSIKSFFQRGEQNCVHCSTSGPICTMALKHRQFYFQYLLSWSHKWNLPFAELMHTEMSSLSFKDLFSAGKVELERVAPLNVPLHLRKLNNSVIEIQFNEILLED